MLCSDETLFAFGLLELAAEIAAQTAPVACPLPCDRWVARSCLQKAIRRADACVAVRALANLYQYDRRATWRHLTIIALEDVGAANLTLLTKLVAAQHDRPWRMRQGGDWPVMVELTRQMASSAHCQATCDLLLNATNNPLYGEARDQALSVEIGSLLESLADRTTLIADRAVAALAAGGGLAEGQYAGDPAAVFETVEYAASRITVAETCRLAWKITRNPMAMLLPLIDDRLSGERNRIQTDDVLPPVQLIAQVPGYALDQFTRLGNNVSRALLRSDPMLRTMLSDAGISPASHCRAVGDLIFLVEGGLLSRREVSDLGDELRLPTRQLRTVSTLSSHCDEALQYIADQAHQIAKLREVHFPQPDACAQSSIDI